MNLRKFISGVSAFAIAASAFAGLAVTANADGTPTAKYSQNFETANDFDYNGTSDNTRFFYGEDDAANDKLAEGNKIIGVSKNENAFKTLSVKYTKKTYVSFDVKLDPGSKSKESFVTLAESLDTNTTNKHDADRANAVKPILKLYIKNNGYNGYFDGNVYVNSDTESFTSKYSNGYRQTHSSNGNTGVTSRDSSGWMHVNAILDFDTHTMDIKISRGATALYSKNGLAFADDNATGLQGVVLTAYDSFSGAYIDNLVVKDAPVASSIAINGDNEITAGNSGTYTAKVLDQYGDEYDDATLTASGNTNATFSDGTITVPGNLENNETITLTASYAGLTDATKTVTASATKGYIINTRPYAAISVDGAAAVSTGRDGKYTFAVGTTGEHSVVISKDGYQEVNTTVTAADNGSTPLALNPNSGIVYQEDFTYVDDNFGFTNATVSNGVLNFPGANGANDKANLTESVSINGSLITLDLNLPAGDKIFGLYLMKDNSDLASFYWNTTTPKVDVTFNPSGTKRTLSGIGKGANHLYQIYVPSTAGSSYYRPTLYIDGVKATSDTFTYFSTDNTSINAIRMTTSNTSVGASINSIKVESGYTNTEPTARVTVDGTATNYLIGTTFTLPAAAEGKVWSADGTTEVESTTITVPAGGATYTQIDDPSAVVTDPSATATWVKDYTATNGNGITYDNDTVASVWAVTITPGTYAVERLGLKLNGTSAIKEASLGNNTVVVGGSPVTFAAVINKVKDDVQSLAAYFNGETDGDGVAVSISVD